MITRNFLTAVALYIAALHSTTSDAFVNSFAVTTTAMGNNVGSLTATATASSSSTTEFGRPVSTSTTALCMARGGGVRARGLEQRLEGPTPTGRYTYGKIDRHGFGIPKETKSSERKERKKPRRKGKGSIYHTISIVFTESRCHVSLISCS